jgi:hypothetical protein
MQAVQKKTVRKFPKEDLGAAYRQPYDLNH